MVVFFLSVVVVFFLVVLVDFFFLLLVVFFLLDLPALARQCAFTFEPLLFLYALTQEQLDEALQLDWLAPLQLAA